MPPIGATLSLLPSILQGGLGLWQNAKGNQFGNTTLPQMPLPPEYSQALALSKARASSPILPGAGYATDQIKGNESIAANQILQAGGNAGNIASLDLGTQKSLRDIQQKGIEHQDAAQTGYEAMLNKVGEFREKQFDWNEGQPYLRNMNAANMLEQTGQSNMFNALKGGIQTGLLTGLFGNKVNPNGGGGGASSPTSPFVGGVGGGVDTSSLAANSLPPNLQVQNSPYPWNFKDMPNTDWSSFLNPTLMGF